MHTGSSHPDGPGTPSADVTAGLGLTVEKDLQKGQLARVALAPLLFSLSAPQYFTVETTATLSPVSWLQQVSGTL